MLKIILWGAFLLTPCFTTNILDYFIGTDLLALACALLAAAWMRFNDPKCAVAVSRTVLLFLGLLLLPALLALLLSSPPNPWAVVKSVMYFMAAYLIFRMSQSQANRWVNGIYWVVLLGVVGNLYVVIGLAQSFHLFVEDQKSLFAIWSYIPQLSGPLLQRNLTSLFLLLVLSALWIQAIRSGFQKGWWLASLLPCAVVLLSNSRSGLLLLIALVLLIFVVAMEKRRFLLHLFPLLTIAYGLALFWHQELQLLGQDDVALGSRLADASVAPRLTIWLSSLHLFLDHPWWGIGYGNLASYYALAQGDVLAQHPDLYEMDAVTYWSHNVMLQFFAEGGLLAGVAMLLLFSAVAKRSWQVLRDGQGVQHPLFPSVVGVGLLLTHGLLSISLYQGFFLALLGLYLAALFPLAIVNQEASPRLDARRLLLFVPALYCFFTWYQFVHTQVEIRAVFDDDPDSDRFITEVAKAIDNPWLARAGLEYLFVNMELTHAPARQWIQLYPMLYHYWLLNQEPLALKRLILQAHLSDNALSEKYLAEQYQHLFPQNGWNKKLSQHIQGGHQAHEALDMQ